MVVDLDWPALRNPNFIRRDYVYWLGTIHSEASMEGYSMKAERVAKKLERLNKAIEYADAYGIDLGGYYQFGTKNLIEMINDIQKETANMTKEQAELLIDAHDIAVLLDDEEEVALLEENNPELLSAYRALVAMAA